MTPEHARWRNVRVYDLCSQAERLVHGIDGPVDWLALQALKTLALDLQLKIEELECQNTSTAAPATTDTPKDETGQPTPGCAHSSPIPSEAIALRRLGTKTRRLGDVTK